MAAQNAIYHFGRRWFYCAESRGRIDVQIEAYMVHESTMPILYKPETVWSTTLLAKKRSSG